MSASAGLDLASIPERIQSEVQRAIQRSIKGVEYIASSGPALGSTQKEARHRRAWAQCGAGPGTGGGLRASGSCAAVIDTNPTC